MTTVCFCAVAATCSPSTAADFNYNYLLHARMKLDPDFDFVGLATPYMQLYRPSVYKQCRNDEFQFHKRRRETSEQMKQVAESVNLDDTVALLTTMSIGNYDFSSNQFYVNEAESTRYWHVSRPGYVPDLPGHFELFLKNPLAIRSIPMTEDAANNFVERRKDRYGNVNRQLYATLNIKLVGFKNAKDEFLGHIDSAKFYSDPHRTQLVYEVTKAMVEASDKLEVQEVDNQPSRKESPFSAASMLFEF